MYIKMKRVMDFILALGLLIVLGIPMCIIAVCIKLEDGGQVIYKSKRMGKGLKEFYVYKFRSMTTKREELHSNLSHEQMVTKVGKVIRKTSLDELPQLFNILKGEMSFIGPRPWISEYYVWFTDEQKRRADVLPGISGSTILLSFGLYIPVISGVKDFLHFDLSSFPLLLALGLGILFGVATVLRIIKRLLDKHRSAMVYAIIGMMLGSLYAIVIGPTTLKVPQNAMTLKTFSILFFIIGAVIVVAFQQLKNLPFYKKQIAEDE